MPLEEVKEKIISILGKEKIYNKINVEYPKIQWGHFSTNIAMQCYQEFLFDSPLLFAEFLAKQLLYDIEIHNVSINGNGFINMIMKASFWKKHLGNIHTQYQKLNKSVNVEYVSANPTGPLHVGHVRTGIVGDVIANLMECAGYNVTREFYVNNCGEQINKLAESIIQYMKNENPTYYISSYTKLLSKEMNTYDINSVKTHAVIRILELIKKDLNKIKISHDHFVFESEIQDLLPMVEKKLSQYIHHETLPNPDGKISTVKTLTIDNQKKILTKSNGDNTYFAHDIAYHQNKIDRKFDIIINIQGSDHIGHVDALHSTVKVLDKNIQINTVLCQMVQLIDEENNIVKMSKRLGNSVSIDELLEHLSIDCIRYIMVSTHANHNFDINYSILNAHHEKNKYFYIQYAYARSVSFLAKSKYREMHIEYIDEHIEIIRKICEWKNIIKRSVRDFAPWYITIHLYELASLFHKLWSGNQKMISDNENRNEFYAALVFAVQKIIKSAFQIINITPLEKI